MSAELPFTQSVNTEAEVSATNIKPSIWTRIKNAAKRVIGATKRGAIATAKTVARPFKAIAAKTKPTMYKIGFVARLAWFRTKTAAKPVTGFFGKLWRRAVRPMLQFALWVMALTTVLVALAVAPLVTVLALATAGLLVLALSYGVEALETAEAHSRLARFALRAIEVIAQMVRLTLYVAAGVMLVAMCIADLAFAVFVAAFVVLTMFQVKGAFNIAFYVWCIASGSWGTLLFFVLFDSMMYSVRTARMKKTAEQAAEREAFAREAFVDSVREDLRDHMAPTAAAYDAAATAFDAIAAKARVVMNTPKDVTPANAPGQRHLWTRGNFLIAKGTEELWGTEHDVAPTSEACVACGTTAFGDRTEDLCGMCLDARDEDEAQRFWGVSRKARHVFLRLTQEGLEAQPEYQASKANADVPQWLVTVKFRTRDCVEHPRAWSLFDDGDIVGSVTYDNDTRKFSAEALGDALEVVWHKGVRKESAEEYAKRLVWEVVNDAKNALPKMPDDVAKVAGDVLAKKKG
jgi:hypothetical protein